MSQPNPYYFRLDSTGFPLIYIPPINAYVGFLPLTKIQIEYFVSSTTESMFDEAWYSTLLNYSGRISATQTNASNYKDMFVAGILPREVQRFALWAGRGYNLMTSYEWRTLYDFAIVSPPIPNIAQAVQESEGVNTDLKVRIRGVLEALNRNVRVNNLADQMLLTNGLIDFVYEDEQQSTFAGHGYRSMVIDAREPLALANRREGARIKNVGCRLVYKE